MYRHFRTDDRLTAVLKMTVTILHFYVEKSSFLQIFQCEIFTFDIHYNCRNNVQSFKQVHRL